MKSEWNCIKTFPDLSGTGFVSFPPLFIIPSGFESLVFLQLLRRQSNFFFPGKATCVKFGADSKYIAVGSMDRNLRIFGLPGEDAPSES